MVAPLRAAYDEAAAYGVPAHVTVLFPFLLYDAVDDGVRADPAGIAASVPAADVTFALPALAARGLAGARSRTGTSGA